MYNLSGCVFIRNCFKGAFCLFESMYQLLPLCDEFVVMDLGSDDGTLDVLKEIALYNPKVRLVHSTFYEQDAAVFASLANDLIAQCTYDNVLYYQSDEIWHEDLVEITKRRFNDGKFNLSFWRYQLKYNFQTIKQFPQIVHRVGQKSDFDFTGDGMNTNESFGVEMCSNWNSGHFLQWGDRYKYSPEKLPTEEMICDVGLIGGFLDNIPDRRRMHLPFWHEGDVMPADGDRSSIGINEWYELECTKSIWQNTETKFNIPEIMKYHIGKQKYELRPSLLESLKGNGWR